MKKRIKSLLTVLSLAALLLNLIPVYAGATATVAPTAAATVAPTTAAATVAPTATVAPFAGYSGEYHAFMGIQTNTKLWIFRNKYDDPNYGYGTDQFKGLSSVSTDPTAKPTYDGTFTDATIDGDGTYTVTLDNPDFADEQRLSLLYVSTDIPLSDSIQITDVKCKFNGSTKQTVATATQDKDSKVYVCFGLLNDWNVDLKDAFAYPWPPTKIEITFTISGLGYPSAAQAAAAAATPTVAPTVAAPTAAATDSTPASTDSSDSSTGLSTPVIIGIVAAAVVVLGVIVALVAKKKKK